MSTIPVGHPLEGCFEKYGWAKEHFDVLQEEIAKRYADGKVEVVTVTGQVDPDNERRYEHVITAVDRTPIRWAILTGDIVHNLRSTLDHLVFELSFLGTGGAPGEKVAFPTSRTRANWKGGYVQNTMLRGVLPSHRAMLYRLQPCYRRHDGASTRAVARRSPNAFADLDDLWNDNKHRLLQPVVVAPTQIDYYLIGIHDCSVTGLMRFNRSIYGRPFEVGTKLAWVPVKITGPDPKVEMKFDISCEIGLRDGVPIRARLASMAQWVREALIWFEPEFRTPVARALWGRPRGGRVVAAPVLHPRRLFFREFTGPLPP